MNTTAVVFLFDADAKGVSSWYGAEFDPAFVQSLGAADPKGRASSVICRGDALVSELAAKVKAASSTGRGISRTVSYDMDLYSTIIWDLADAFAGQWHTVDLETFPLVLGRKNVHCISVPSLPFEFRDPIDGGLRRTRGYLGAIDIDLGNPIQVQIFIKSLIKDAIVGDGQVVLELSSEGNADSTFIGASDFKPNGERRVRYGELSKLRPPIPESSRNSVRGTLSWERYAAKRQFSLQEKVVAALVSAARDGKTPFAIAASPTSSDPIEASLPENKFVRYLLDALHPKGGSKAKFFSEDLGIGPDDWRFLAAQFHDGLLKAELSEVGVAQFEGGYGINFNAVIPVKGRNDRVASVQTGWIMEPGQVPRLLTAFPAKRDAIEGEQADGSSVVPKELKGDERWEAIYSVAAAAGKRAAESAT